MRGKRDRERERGTVRTVREHDRENLGTTARNGRKWDILRDAFRETDSSEE